MYRESFLVVLLLIIIQIKSDKIEVRVKQGTVIGHREATVFEGIVFYAFYGVPYAQPPIGKLRFKDPESYKKWNDPIDASQEHHGACAQAHIVHTHAQFGVEDCLYLNIFTPNLPRDANYISKPVIVWIHGYAFTSSFSHMYGSDFLIENDVLFVSLTHRIGVFGFLKMNETDSNANMGLKDIVMALKWIKNNINKFGGDLTKITVMGSGSAGTLLSLLLTTKNKNLFAKMILQSGAIFSPSIFQGDHNLETVKLKAELKNMGSPNLMKAGVMEIIAASQKMLSNKDIINSQKSLISFSPMIEAKSKKSLIIKRPEKFYKNMNNLNLNFPILIGFNSQESISELIPFLHNPRYIQLFTSFFKYMVPFTDGCQYNYTSEIYKKVADKIKLQYFKEGFTAKSIEDLMKYASDLRIFPIYKFIKTHLKVSTNKMYVYKFNYIGTFNAVRATSLAGVNLKVKGAASGDEICYLLKCEPLWESYVKIRNDDNSRDRQFIKEISKLWANFAKFGESKPYIPFGNAKWLPMNLKENNILVIGKESKVINSTSEENMFSFWNEIYDNYYSDEHCNKHKHDEL